MQWQKAKTILIVVFLLINLFLLYYLLPNRHTDSRQTLQYLTDALAKNEIHLRMDTLPETKDSIFVPEFSVPSLTEKQIEKLIVSPVKNENGYTNSDNTVKLEFKSNEFSYENSALENKKFRNVTVKNVVSKLEPYVKALGVEEYVYPVDILEIQDEIVVEYAYRIENRKLFDSRLRFTVTKNGIRRIRGHLSVPDSKNGFSYSLSRLETILMSLAQKKEESISITNIELGYYFLSYTDAMVSQAIPVYRITTQSGDILMDARDGVETEERILSRSGAGGN